MTYRTRRDEGSTAQWIGQQWCEDPRGHNCCSVSSGVGRRNTLTRALRGCDAALRTAGKIVSDWGAPVARPPSHWLAPTRRSTRALTPTTWRLTSHVSQVNRVTRARLSANKFYISFVITQLHTIIHFCHLRDQSIIIRRDEIYFFAKMILRKRE